MRFSAIPCLLLTLLLAALSGPAHAEQTWTEIRSPHFRVLTDGSPREGRMVAHEFEQMRYVFVLRFGNDQIESGAPLTIVAAHDANTFRALEPALWKAQGDKVAGEFHRGWEKQFALVRLDTWSSGAREVVYHEYTHSVLHANAHWLPTWLDEGMAEFYAYTRFQGDRIYVGAPSERLGLLRQKPLIPLTAMLDVNSRSPYYHDDQKVQLFYAESWALVHFMIFGPGMDHGDKLNTFFQLLQTGTDQQTAFRKVFGDPHAFDSALSLYLQHFSFAAGVLPPDHGPDPKSFAERKLSPAETDYELGCFHIGARDRPAGRSLIEQAIALDPRLAGAHEELGFLDFDAGQDEPAQGEWHQALALDPALPRSLFAVTMSGKPLGAQAPDELRATQATLEKVTTLAPRFAPAYVELALTEWRLNAIQQAYNDAHQAETLEPWRAGYHILTGHILLRGNQPALAAAYSRYVATHWFGPDHDEAVELWEAVPTAQRGDGPALALDMPPAVEVAHGTLTSVSCDSAPGGKVSVTLMPDGTPGKPAGAQPLTFSSNGRMMVGFSDTLWWGEDHFSLCHHLAGHPAVLAYKPGGSGAGELVDLEVHDNLPSTPPPVPASAPAAGTTAKAEAASSPAQP